MGCNIGRSYIRSVADMVAASARLGRTLARKAALPVILSTTAILVGCAPYGYVSSGLVTRGTQPFMVVGSGKLVTQEFQVEGFTGVEIHSALEAAIAPSESYSVAVTADDNVVDLVEVLLQGQTLRLDLKPGSYQNTTIRVRISLPDLDGLVLSSASRASLSEFPMQGSLDLKLSGASKLVGRVQGTEVRIVASEASSVNLGGQATRLTLAASGASQTQLGDLSLEEATASLREASTATVNVQGKLDAELRSASTLYYLGNPTLRNVTAVEASSLKRR